MLTLYEHPLSPYAQKCKIVLLEKGIPFEATLPNGFGSGQAGGDFTVGNPRHEVPMLIDGDLRIFDSTVILEYIEEKWPTPPMLPRDPAARARIRMLEDVADTHYEAINWGLMEIGFFRRATGALADTLKTRAAEQTAGLLSWLETEIGAREWFNGESFGWADAAIVPHVGTSAAAGLGPAPASPLALWLDRCKARPSVAAVDRAAQEWRAGVPSDFSGALAQGFRRQYRDHRLEWMMRSGGLSVVLDGLEKNNLRFGNEF
ncbi:MAG TPA: glutathione S-transferase family protein [Aliidongia sp.]|nr:glutathione S-transferase family protein [Aliidongia sp.]